MPSCVIIVANWIFPSGLRWQLYEQEGSSREMTQMLPCVQPQNHFGWEAALRCL
jgi:hypothetical protein